MANISQSPQESVREQNQKNFRQCLRQADKFIVEGAFDEAAAQIGEAKKIDPTNPFIKAFEERIALFRKKVGGASGAAPASPSAPASASAPPAAPAPASVPPAAPAEKAAQAAPAQVSGHAAPAANPQPKPQHPPAPPPPPPVHSPSREVAEQALRVQIENEFREKFTQEVRKAEESAARVIQHERARMEEQKKELHAHYEDQLAKARAAIEEDFQARFAADLAEAEKKLVAKQLEELKEREAAIRRDVTAEHARALGEADERLRRELAALHAKEQEAVLAKEREGAKHREEQLRKEADARLLAELHKTESTVREQTVKKELEEREAIRKKLTAELKATADQERRAVEKKFEEAKKELTANFAADAKRLAKEAEEQMRAKLEEARKNDAAEMEKRLAAARTEVEREIKKKYDDCLDAERKRLTAETEKALAAGQKKLEEERDALVRTQAEKLREVRREIRAEMEKVFFERLQRVANEYDHKIELLGAKIPDTREGRMDLYKAKMLGCYVTGQPSVENARMLMELKELLELTFDDHLALEADVRMRLYVERVERQILAGEINPGAKGGLDELKRQFGITTEESARLEPYILSAFQRLATKGRLLVVDDDLLLLETLEDLLTDHGYQVVTAQDVGTALEKLERHPVDFILSDIKFDYEELDGFKFFKAVQEIPRFRNLPFVFMSSLEDGVIVRSGMQLGVDDYLTKPVDPDLLFAVIDGKLKRSRAATARN